MFLLLLFYQRQTDNEYDRGGENMTMRDNICRLMEEIICDPEVTKRDSITWQLTYRRYVSPPPFAIGSVSD